MQFRIVGNISGIWISWSADLNASRLLLLNLVLDPFIYVLTRKHYRDALKEMLCCHCCNGKMQRYFSIKKLSSSRTGLSGSKLSNPSLHNIDKIEENGCIVEFPADVSPNNKLLNIGTPIKCDEAKEVEIDKFSGQAICEGSDDVCRCETTGLADTYEVFVENASTMHSPNVSQFSHVRGEIEDKLTELNKGFVLRANTTPIKHGVQRYTERKELCKSFPSTTVEKSPLRNIHVKRNQSDSEADRVATAHFTCRKQL